MRSRPSRGPSTCSATAGSCSRCPRWPTPAFEARLAEEAAKLGGVVADDATWDAVRIEHGLPRFGVEFDTTHYPQEAALEKLAVSFQKGCYLGQEVVYMLQERGHVKRKLVPLDLDAGELPVAGAAVTTAAGEVVGEIRSATLGPSSGKPVAIAMVKWAQAKAGTELNVAARRRCARRPRQSFRASLK